MLPIRVIDRIFERLTMTYGRAFMGQFEGQSINDLKSLWAHELSAYGDHLMEIAWALENLPERPPNTIEFRNLCRHAPREQPLAIEYTKADPERVKRELAKLAPMLEPIREARRHHDMPDYRAWARRLIARHESGAYRSTPTALAMAREALRTEYGT